MAGRFRLYADADIHGPFVHALKRTGRDLARAVDLYPEGQDDRALYGSVLKRLTLIGPDQ